MRGRLDAKRYLAYRREYKRKWSQKNRALIAAAAKRSRQKPEHRERAKAARRQFHSANLLAQRAANRAWAKANAAGLRKRRAAHRAANVERYRAATRKWHRENPGRSRAHVAKRHAAIRHRVPRWADLAAIERIYVECQRRTKETGVLHHVDHLVPLQGRTVSGLHVESNLRIVPAVVNQTKHNLLLEDVA